MQSIPLRPVSDIDMPKLNKFAATLTGNLRRTEDELTGQDIDKAAAYIGAAYAGADSYKNFFE